MNKPVFAFAMALLAATTATIAHAQGTWSAAGELATPRFRYAASVLADGRALVAGGLGGPTITLASAELFDPATSQWSSAGSMSVSRSRHTATTLPDGRVLVAGGRVSNAGGTTETAEIFDPFSGWLPTGSMAIPRDNHTATLLADGRVLVAGGVNDAKRHFDALHSAEIYDPATGQWTPADSLLVARFVHSATLLADGRVLVSGGSLPGGDCTFLQVSEIYDPIADKWGQPAPMSVGRSTHAATLLPDGRVLAAGGLRQDPACFAVTDSAELYDPGTNRWTPTGSLNTARRIVSAPVLADGRVLVAGGLANVALASAELYDPATGTWSFTGAMHDARSGFRNLLLPDGRVLAPAGMGPAGILTRAELYQP